MRGSAFKGAPEVLREEYWSLLDAMDQVDWDAISGEEAVALINEIPRVRANKRFGRAQRDRTERLEERAEEKVEEEPTGYPMIPDLEEAFEAARQKAVALAKAQPLPTALFQVFERDAVQRLAASDAAGAGGDRLAPSPVPIRLLNTFASMPPSTSHIIQLEIMERRLQLLLNGVNPAVAWAGASAVLGLLADFPFLHLVWLPAALLCSTGVSPRARGTSWDSFERHLCVGASLEPSNASLSLTAAAGRGHGSLSAVGGTSGVGEETGESLFDAEDRAAVDELIMGLEGTDDPERPAAKQLPKIGGVYYKRDGNYKAWAASWHIKGKRVRRYFTVKKHGFRNAYLQAVKARREAEQQDGISTPLQRAAWALGWPVEDLQLLVEQQLQQEGELPQHVEFALTREAIHALLADLHAHVVRLSGLDVCCLPTSNTSLCHYQQNALLQLFVVDRVLLFVSRCRTLAELSGLPELFGASFASCRLPSQLPVPHIRHLLFALCSPSLSWITEDMYLPEPLLLRAQHARHELGLDSDLETDASSSSREAVPFATDKEPRGSVKGASSQLQQRKSEGLAEEDLGAFGSPKPEEHQQGAVKGPAAARSTSSVLMSAVQQFLVATSEGQKKGASPSAPVAAINGTPPQWSDHQQLQQQDLLQPLEEQEDEEVEEQHWSPMVGLAEGGAPESPLGEGGDGHLEGSPRVVVDPPEPTKLEIEALRRGSGASMRTTSSEVVAYLAGDLRLIVQKETPPCFIGLLPLLGPTSIVR
ncbi:hypothetical protein cyc_06301 [Cyclospora cayetanensis]|uniref:Uncharacterized protein n=1 Tax=Cyclospora cayetanensis TaxID=88456 RepID=A0A1D3D0V5_9EIME|nr:hypothetical protein cyc_06301 [Cyclospora cayetanensis]